jgi:hypothetical protein
MEDEIRIISCDIALMKGSRNDNSVYSLFRLIRDGDGYKKQVVYIEAWNGLSSSKQSVRIKQLFFDFQADYIILDANGIGLSIYEELISVQYCEERDIEYPPLTSYNDESMAKLEERKARRVIKELFYHYCGVLKPICPENRIVRVVTDYISGMTDRYAVERFKENFMPTGLKTSARDDYLFRLASTADC